MPRGCAKRSHGWLPDARVKGCTPSLLYNPRPKVSVLQLYISAPRTIWLLLWCPARVDTIGDVNESNILVGDTALVTLVDTDSFRART